MKGLLIFIKIKNCMGLYDRCEFYGFRNVFNRDGKYFLNS